MLQEIKCPDILGKELDNCVVAWKEARKTQTMFNQTSTHQDSLKFPTETDFFKHHMSAKYIQQHAPVLDRPLKEISPASLEKIFKRLYEIWNRAWHALQTVVNFIRSQLPSEIIRRKGQERGRNIP